MKRDFSQINNNINMYKTCVYGGKMQYIHIDINYPFQEILKYE